MTPAQFVAATTSPVAAARQAREPPTPGVGETWTAKQDDQGNTYYVSSQRRTTWLCPDPSLLLGSPALNQAAAHEGAGELRTELAHATGGGLFRGLSAELDDWESCEDENGKTYYFNSQTGTTSWVKPLTDPENVD